MTDIKSEISRLTELDAKLKRNMDSVPKESDSLVNIGFRAGCHECINIVNQHAPETIALLLEMASRLEVAEKALEDAAKGIDALRFYFSKYGDTRHPGMIRSANSLIKINEALSTITAPWEGMR